MGKSWWFSAVLGPRRIIFLNNTRKIRHWGTTYGVSAMSPEFLPTSILCHCCAVSAISQYINCYLIESWWYICSYTGPPLVQVMSIVSMVSCQWRLAITLTNSHLYSTGPLGLNPNGILIKCTYLTKSMSNFRLQNVGHFVHFVHLSVSRHYDLVYPVFSGTFRSWLSDCEQQKVIWRRWEGAWGPQPPALSSSPHRHQLVSGGRYSLRSG